MFRVHLHLWWIYFSAAVAAASPAFAQLRAEPRISERGVKGERRSEEAVQRGLAFLSARQNDDGSFGNGEARINVGVAALSGMAFLASGNTPTRGKYADATNRCLDFVLANVQENGFIAHPRSSMHGPMYSHGFATLFLAEAYGMAPRPEVRDKLAKAVRLIVNTQNNEGGWRYFPERKDADVSVTVCQVMALRSARNDGLYVPNETIDRCITYIKRAQNPDGGFTYMLNPLGESAFPRSAAGVVALYSAGIYDSQEVKKGVDYILRNRPQGPLNRDQYYFYGHYYAAQALWQPGGDRWNEWYSTVREELLTRELSGGGWLDPYGAEYATAMACIILTTPTSYLPIFQK